MRSQNPKEETRGESRRHLGMCPAINTCPPLHQPQSCTPKPGWRVTCMSMHCLSDAFHLSQLLYAPSCLPHSLAGITGGPGTPTAVLFPGPSLPCRPLALRRLGQGSCQPGSSRESRSSFANTAEITGFISRHMVVSSGREEAAAASLPNS